MSFADYMGMWRGSTAIVAGCGESLTNFELPWVSGWNSKNGFTIGVNDVAKRFVPDYCLVVNHYAEFQRLKRADNVGKARLALFTHIPKSVGVEHPNIVVFSLGKQNGTDLDDPERLDYTSNSPYMAVILAAKMGAKKIGLIGVDFTGLHYLSRAVPKINQEYGKLKTALDQRGIEAYNLSPVSRLEAFPKCSLEEFYG